MDDVQKWESYAGRARAARECLTAFQAMKQSA